MLHISSKLIESWTANYLMGQQIPEANGIWEERTLESEGSCKRNDILLGVSSYVATGAAW